MPLYPKVGRQQPAMRLSYSVMMVILWIGVVLHLLPFVFMFSTSIKSSSETFSSPPTQFPKEPTSAAWELVFAVSTHDSEIQRVEELLPQPMWVYFRNSMVMTLGTLALSLPITSFAAYANSKLQRGRGKRYFFLFFIGTLMLPGAVTLIPQFLLSLNFPFPLNYVPTIPGTETEWPTIRTWNTMWALIIPGVFNAFNFLLFKGFFDTIPNSIIQAARVDGGSEFNIFRRIILPMSIPVYAVTGYFQFTAVWDSFLWPSLVIQDTEKTPMSVGVYNLMNAFTQAGATNAAQAEGGSRAMREMMEAGLTWNGLMVLGILQTIPMFFIFIIAREYLMKGTRLRGLK